MDLQVTPSVLIPDDELEESFIHGSGPGGQNVNKVATAVQLRFDVRGTSALPWDVKARLLDLAGSRATLDGVLVIDARRQRTRERNREDARARLAELITRALQPPPPPRKPTRPSRSARRRRVETKRRRGDTKKLRGSVRGDGD